MPKDLFGNGSEDDFCYAHSAMRADDNEVDAFVSNNLLYLLPNIALSHYGFMAYIAEAPVEDELSLKKARFPLCEG